MAVDNSIRPAICAPEKTGINGGYGCMSYLLYAGCVLMVVGGLFPLCLGLLTIFYWIKPAKAPADDSNRLNNIASWWIGLTRPEVLAKSYRFFRQDIMDNVHGIERYPHSPPPPPPPPKRTLREGVDKTRRANTR